MSVLPHGTVTLLFSDIEGSTQLARRMGDRYAEALAAQRRLMRDAFAASGGSEVDTQGDSFFVAFASAREAVAAAADAQRGTRTRCPVRGRGLTQVRQSGDARWLGRLALESDDLSLHDVHLAAAALHALPRRPDSALQVLRVVSR